MQDVSLPNSLSQLPSYYRYEALELDGQANDDVTTAYPGLWSQAGLRCSPYHDYIHQEKRIVAI